jgi:transposase
MPRLTEVQRGQAIALLMQGQRQQQVALQFGVNVSTIERLVRHLRDTGRVADHRRRPRVATPRQDRSIASLEIVWDHVPPTKPYDASDVHE